MGIIKSDCADFGAYAYLVSPMGPVDFLNHVFNFLVPALWVAVLVTLMTRLVMRKTPVAFSLSAQVAINFIVSASILGLGLWYFDRDGKMSTYAAMTILCATSQWLMLRGWRA
jgi:hypothetical protein